MNAADEDCRHMARAIALARRGEGAVEPNPMVGCVIVRDGAVVGEGWHQRFGGPHAEIEALRAAGENARGATVYVTLEPCCHVGKTPPCVDAIIAAGVQRAIIGARDPNPLVDGRGAAALAAAGIAVAVDVLERQARELIAPFAKLMTQRRPWVIAKWAMTLDGKIAARTGDSRWISGEGSRARVHALRGRVDGIVVGRGTAAADDPLLTARPQGVRTATRIVLDSAASMSLESQLVRTASEAPVLVVASPTAPSKCCEALRDRGVEVWQPAASDELEDDASASTRVPANRWLDELGRREMTNILVEGGGQVLGALFDAGAIDEVHAFIAPKIAGGAGPAPIAGRGIEKMAAALQLAYPLVELLEPDVYIHGRLSKPGFPA